jgi:hypothetical protein
MADGPGRRPDGAPTRSRPEWRGEGDPRPRGEGVPPSERGHRGFLSGAPEFHRPDRPPPPREIVFELIDTAPFAPEWFEPHMHAAAIGAATGARE